MPQPGPEQVLIRVRACGVCRTDLHIVDGELAHPKLPLILGHEIVGKVAAAGSAVRQFQLGDRLGVPWLGYTYGPCRYCRGAGRTCATTPASPATPWTAATPNTPWPTSATVSRCPRPTAMPRPRRCCAPG